VRIKFLPPPGARDLREWRIQELVRDYPEVVRPLEALGIDVGEAGAEPLSSVLGEGDTWVSALLEHLRWREPRRA
jgi:hypothetical protein